MKKSSFLALAIAPMILGAPLAIQAQSVSTDPVGFVKSPLADGSFTIVGVNLTKAAVYGATIASSTTDSVTASDEAAAIDALVSEGSYYIEITGGALAGDRIDVVSASGNVITLDTTAAHNTLTDASAIPADSTFVIREHNTFSDLSDGIGGESLFGGTGVADSDRILTYEGGSFVQHFFGSDGNWYSSDGTFTLVNDKPIPPGSGVLFYANPLGGTRDLELLVLGSVRNNDLVVPLSEGFQIVSTGFPMDLSPVDLVMNTDYFTGGTGTADSDQILTYEAGSFVPHFLGSDGNWYTTDGTFTPVTDVDFFSAQGAVLVYRQSADSGFRVGNQLQ